MALRHVLSVVALPGTVTIVIPVWIAWRYGVGVHAPASLVEGLQVLAGLVLGLAGLALFSACLAGFATRGKGTLAPWDPPRNLVVAGPYRFVRNPMISGVIFVLFGEALLLRSLPHAIWAAIFFAANLVYIPLVEEPQLEDRFGDAYRRYRKHVRGLVPRLSPWHGEDEELD